MSPAIALTSVDMHEEDVEAVMECLRSGWLTLGPRIKQLEADLVAWSGSPHAVTVSSGSAALQLACRAAGVGPGDEVVVPALSSVAVAHATRFCGAEPVLCDVVSATAPTLDVAGVERCITPATKAVIATHLFGYPAGVVDLREFCDTRGLVLIEDATDAVGASIGPHGAQAGTIGHLGCFSFSAASQLCVGEGGMVTSADETLAGAVRSLRSHAMTSGTWDRHRGHQDSYDVVDVGYNYRLDEPRAALAIARLKRLSADIERRRAVVRLYRERLAPVEAVELMWDSQAVERSSHRAFGVLLADEAARDALQARLAARDIESGTLPALHSFSAYASSASGRSLPVAEEAAARHLLLPLAASTAPETVAAVVAAVREAVLAPV